MRAARKIRRLVQAASFRASPEADKALWTEVLKEHGRRRTADQTPHRRSWGRLGMPLWTTRMSATALLAVGVAIGVVIGATIPGPQEDSNPRAGSPGETRTSDVQPDLFALRQMAAAQDVKGLAAILAGGPFEGRLVAANFLAKMAPLPALETVSVQAAGELRADRQGGNPRLYSTGHADWLELADGTITVHGAATPQRTTLVRLTRAREEDAQPGKDQGDLDRLRKERGDLEKEMAGARDIPADVNQLRSRIDVWNHILDASEGAVYISAAGGGLHLQDRVRRREAHLFPSDSGVRAEWHGVTVDANSITLLNGLAPVRTDGPLVPPADWRSRFDRRYSLADGEILRWVRPPFIPERQYHLQGLRQDSRVNPGPRPPFLFLSFRWDGTLHSSGVAAHEGTLGFLLGDLGREFGLKQYEIGGPTELLQLPLGGDWIVRADTSLEQRFGALERILERQWERRIRIARRRGEREVIVVRGRYERQPLEGHRDTDPIYLFAETAPDKARPLGGSGQTTVAGLLHQVGARFHRPVILEAQGLDEIPIRFQPCVSYTVPTGRRSERQGPFTTFGDGNLDPVLANLTRQISVEFSCETRPFDTWLVTEIEEPRKGQEQR
ncbi:MAG: hypothetical protein FJ280_00180 [Planctomycetes bacterium]|nr:hypothetical protein [Planctomycetota bacterium]